MAACAGPTGGKAEGASPLNERPKPSRVPGELCATVREARVSRCVPSKLLWAASSSAAGNAVPCGVPQSYSAGHDPAFSGRGSVPSGSSLHMAAMRFPIRMSSGRTRPCRAYSGTVHTLLPSRSAIWAAVTHPCSRNCSRRRCKRPLTPARPRRRPTVPEPASGPVEDLRRLGAGVRFQRRVQSGRGRFVYLHVDLVLQEKAMARTTSGKVPPERYRSEDEVPAFLNALCLFQVRCPSMHVPCPSLAGNSESSGTRHYDEANVA